MLAVCVEVPPATLAEIVMFEVPSGVPELAGVELPPQPMRIIPIPQVMMSPRGPKKLCRSIRNTLWADPGVDDRTDHSTANLKIRPHANTRGNKADAEANLPWAKTREVRFDFVPQSPVTRAR
jgi:hypothetical protein